MSLRWKNENQAKDDPNRDRGGRILPGKKWRSFAFVVEVTLESPKDVDEEEAAEDASEFMTVIGAAKGRTHKSFCSVTRIDEYGRKRPKDAGVVIKGRTKPPLEDRIKAANERPIKKKPTKAKKKNGTKGNKGKGTKRI